MDTCSIHRELEIVPGDMSDYGLLAAYHYRDSRPVGVKAVYTIRPKRALGSFGRRPAGVIVYTMPNPRIELRTIATGGAFSGLDRQTELELLNRHVRCIARVIVEPRFRGIGLAVRLVRETMPMLNVPIIEALGVMPLVNPFLERAGMKSFEPRVPVEHVELLEAFSAVGIEEGDLIDPETVQREARPIGAARRRLHRGPDAAVPQEPREPQDHARRDRTNAVHPGQADAPPGLLHLVQSIIAD